METMVQANSKNPSTKSWIDTSCISQKLAGMVKRAAGVPVPSAPSQEGTASDVKASGEQRV